MAAAADNKPSSQQGYFITLEGGDGAGKTTQAALLAEWIAAQYGREVVRTFEPGDSELGRQLRQLIQHGEAIDDRTEALLFAADRAHHVATVIRPALARGAVVICDRYIDSSIAYQGAGRALPPHQVAALSQWATAGLQPDVTLLFDLTPQQAMARLTGPADRIEGAGLDFQQKVRDGYLTLAAANPERWLTISAAPGVAEVASAVQKALKPRLDGKLQ